MCTPYCSVIDVAYIQRTYTPSRPRYRRYETAASCPGSFPTHPALFPSARKRRGKKHREAAARASQPGSVPVKRKKKRRRTRRSGLLRQQRPSTAPVVKWPSVSLSLGSWGEGRTGAGWGVRCVCDLASARSSSGWAPARAPVGRGRLSCAAAGQSEAAARPGRRWLDAALYRGREACAGRGKYGQDAWVCADPSTCICMEYMDVDAYRTGTCAGIAAPPACAMAALPTRQGGGRPGVQRGRKTSRRLAARPRAWPRRRPSAVLAAASLRTEAVPPGRAARVSSAAGAGGFAARCYVRVYEYMYMYTDVARRTSHVVCPKPFLPLPSAAIFCQDRLAPRPRTRPLFSLPWERVGGERGTGKQARGVWCAPHASSVIRTSYIACPSQQRGGPAAPPARVAGRCF